MPQPPSGHRSAAANARTASCFPHPSGPARRYAWCGRSTARSRNAIASAWAGTVARTGRTSTDISDTLREGVVGSLLALAQELPQRLLHMLLHDLRRLVRLDRDEPLGVLLRDLQVGVGDLRVEIAALELHPVGSLGGTEEAELRLEVQQDHEDWKPPLGRPDVERQDARFSQPARDPLIRERGVDVSV